MIGPTSIPLSRNLRGKLKPASSEMGICLLGHLKLGWISLYLVHWWCYSCPNGVLCIWENNLWATIHSSWGDDNCSSHCNPHWSGVLEWYSTAGYSLHGVLGWTCCVPVGGKQSAVYKLGLSFTLQRLNADLLWRSLLCRSVLLLACSLCSAMAFLGTLSLTCKDAVNETFPVAADCFQLLSTSVG